MVEGLVVRRDDDVAFIELDRPRASNALGSAFWRNFGSMVSDLDVDGRTRALVLSGSGRHFCAGMDLLAFAEGEITSTDTAAQREVFTHFVRGLQDALTALERVRFPVIAAVHGACIGAGLELVAACDLRYVSEDAYFRIEEINIGMMPDLGSLQRLPGLLPAAVVREMAFLGRTLRSAEAHRVGFVNDVLPTSEAVLAAASEAARDIAQRAPLAVAGSKAALHYARDHSVEDGLSWAALAQSALWNPGDIGAAVAARGQSEPATFSPLLPTARPGQEREE